MFERKERTKFLTTNGFVKEVCDIGLLSRTDQSELTCSPDGIALFYISTLAKPSDWTPQKLLLMYAVSSLKHACSIRVSITWPVTKL